MASEPTATVRIALVGAGRMGRTHLRAVESNRRARAVAVVEPVAAAAAGLDRDRLAVHGSVEELLAAGGFDAALIAAPSDLHLDLVRTFAAAGVPVLCEKPVGLTADEAREALAASEEAGIVLQVGYWRRFVPELAALRERIAAGELGLPSLIVCNQWDEAPPSMQFRHRSGGIGIDMGVHEIDQVRWLLGQEFDRLVAVPAGDSAAEAAAGDPDSAVALARLSGGSAATITLGRRFPGGDACWLELFADDGYERLLFLWGDRAESAFQAALAAQVDAFAEAVAGGRREGADGADAVAALEVAERIGAELQEVAVGRSV